MQPLPVGMIGVAGFGGYRRGQMRASGLFRLVAAFDRNAEALSAVCKEENCRPCGSVDELLKTPGIEGLVISTGVDTHAEFALRGMAAGLHVFVEKPLCSSVAEIRQLIDARQRTGKVIGVGHSDHATDSIYRLSRQYLDSGALGTLAAYEENTSHSGGLLIKPGDWRGLRERNPGGMLLQCGVHSLHRLVHLFGPITHISAMMRYDAHPGTQTADVANVLIRHASGLLGTLNCYHVTAYIHELRLLGTKGNLYMDTHQRKAWFQERKPGPAEHRVEVPVPPADDSAAFANLANWHQAIRTGGAAQPALEDGIDAVLPVFAAELSDQEGRTVRLEEMGVTLRR